MPVLWVVGLELISIPHLGQVNKSFKFTLGLKTVVILFFPRIFYDNRMNLLYKFFIDLKYRMDDKSKDLNTVELSLFGD